MKCMIVGAGFGAMHSYWLNTFDDVEIAALIYSNDDKNASQLKQKYNISRIGTNMASVLKSDAFDLISIVSPPITHTEYLRTAFDAKVPVVLDKPIAESLSAMQDIEALAAGSDTKAYTFFQWRLHPAFQRLAAILQSGELGDVGHIDAEFAHGFLAAPATSWPWRHRSETAGGGSLGDLGVHLFDLLRFVSGSEWTVTAALCGVAHSKRQGPEGPLACHTDDFADVRLIASGKPTTAKIATTRVALGEAQIKLRLFGTKGVAVVLLDPETTGAKLIVKTGDGEPDITEFRAGEFNPYGPILAALNGDTEAATRPASIADGVAAQKLMCAAVAASQIPNLPRQ